MNMYLCLLQVIFTVPYSFHNRGLSRLLFIYFCWAWGRYLFLFVLFVTRNRDEAAVSKIVFLIISQ